LPLCGLVPQLMPMVVELLPHLAHKRLLGALFQPLGRDVAPVGTGVHRDVKGGIRQFEPDTQPVRLGLILSGNILATPRFLQNPMNAPNACETRQTFSLSHGSRMRPLRQCCVQRALAWSAVLPPFLLLKNSRPVNGMNTSLTSRHTVSPGGSCVPTRSRVASGSPLSSCCLCRRLGQRSRCCRT